MNCNSMCDATASKVETLQNNSEDRGVGNNIVRVCFKLCSKRMHRLMAGILVAIITVYPHAYAAESKAKFIDITETAKVGAMHHAAIFDTPFKPMMNMYNAILVGAAVTDYDNDGFLDIYVNDTAPGTKNHLYRNNCRNSNANTFIEKR